MADHSYGGARRAGSGHAVFFGGGFYCSARVGHLFALPGIHDGPGLYSKARWPCVS